MNSTAIAPPSGGDFAALLWQGHLLVPGSALVLLALASLYVLSAKDDWHKLPGPKPASRLLGHLPQMNVPHVHRFWQQCCDKYGAAGMFRVRLLHMRVVVLSDPLLIQTVLSRAHDLPKASQLYDAVDELFSTKGIRSFFNTHDYDEWKVVRKGTAPAFSPANIRKSYPLLMNVTRELCDTLAARVAGGQRVVEVSEAAMRVTLDVIGATGYGYDFNARSYAHCELFDIIPPLLGEFTLRATNPLRTLAHRCLPFLPQARLYRGRVKACHKWWRILVASVRQTDLARAAAEGDTSLRVCLAQLPFDDEQLMPNLAAYLIAGFETTAHSIAWALYEIASNPGVQRRLEAELGGAGLLGPGARPLEFGDLAALPFLNCVLKETMRLHPVASNGTIRKTTRELSLGGYRLAAGTLLWVPLIALLTSAHNWERAHEFWPERWEMEAAAPDGAAAGPTPLGNAANQTKTYLPFSDGPRDCIGQALAMMEARAVLASMVGRFQLEVAPEMGSREDVRNDEVMKLTLQCGKGIRLHLELRQ